MIIATVARGLCLVLIASHLMELWHRGGLGRMRAIVLGIYGYTYGSVLGVFLAGMLTKSRGNDYGNLIAMVAGFVIVCLISGLPNAIAKIFGAKLYDQPSWLPVMEFPWWICFGTIVTFFVAILFPTGREHQPPPLVAQTS